MHHFQFFMLGCFAPYAVLHAKEIWESLAAVGIKKDVEPWIDMDRRQFARQVDGNERLVFGTLEKFPLSFWQEFAWRMVLKVGLPERVRRSLPLLLAYEGQKAVMAKMNLAEERAERSA